MLADVLEVALHQGTEAKRLEHLRFTVSSQHRAGTEAKRLERLRFTVSSQHRAGASVSGLWQGVPRLDFAVGLLFTVMGFAI